MGTFFHWYAFCWCLWLSYLNYRRMWCVETR